MTSVNEGKKKYRAQNTLLKALFTGTGLVTAYSSDVEEKNHDVGLLFIHSVVNCLLGGLDIVASSELQLSITFSLLGRPTILVVRYILSKDKYIGLF